MHSEGEGEAEDVWRRNALRRMRLWYRRVDPVYRKTREASEAEAGRREAGGGHSTSVHRPRM